MSPILSIVIPCYNSGATLENTLISVLKQSFQNWEAIIVNDGSTDNVEEIAMKYLDLDSRFVYLKKKNGGLGSARNHGIKNAKGDFILPLDSDNEIEPDFITHALTVFEENKKIGVIYGNAQLFGERAGVWKLEEFNLEKMLAHNYIDACAIFKKVLWETAGGYDENMPHQGHEDWDFWIALANINAEFYYLDEVTFKYYVSKHSMINSFDDQMVLENQNYIVAKYPELYHKKYLVLKNDNSKLKEKFGKKLKSKKFVVDLFFKTFFGVKIFGVDIED